MVPHKDRQTWHRAWWTRERVLQAMLRFYHDHHIAPTSTDVWHSYTSQRGGGGGDARNRRYPSAHGVLSHFTSFREAWTAAGIEVDRGWEPWSDIEEWYLREGVGILSRKELAADLNRTPDAVHRRLYDMGLDAYSRWGWTLNRLERATGVQRYVFERYMGWGDLPYLRGSKTVYVDPGDLTIVTELDFDHLPADLERAMLRSLRERLVTLLAGGDWRAERVWQVHQELGTGRVRNRRRIEVRKPDPKPNAIDRGHWVRVTRDLPGRPGMLGRVGLVHFTYWATQRSGNGIRGDAPASWYARVEFKKQHQRGENKRVSYSVPLNMLARVAEPGAAPSNVVLRCTCGGITVCGPGEIVPDACTFCHLPVGRAS